MFHTHDCFCRMLLEDQVRVINVRAQAQMVPFIILQKALRENNDNDTHNNKDEAHLRVKKESVSVNLLPKYMRIHIYL